MRALLILSLILGFVIFTNAQKTNLSGTIYDFNGAVIAGAKIQAKDLDNKIYQTYTNDEGKYNFELTEGFYSIEFFANGFKSLRMKKYWIATKYTQKMFLDLVLETSGETIEHTIRPEKIKRKNNK